MSAYPAIDADVHIEEPKKAEPFARKIAGAWAASETFDRKKAIELKREVL